MMEKRVIGLGFREVYRDTAPRMENQKDNKAENKMERRGTIVV